ncbi:hypothetical protein NKH18_18170 [Streptomyces sp. M10(2022)]
MEQARLLQVQRADPAVRGRHAMKAILSWIYAQADRRPLRISGFLDSPGIYFSARPCHPERSPGPCRT